MTGQLDPRLGASLTIGAVLGETPGDAAGLHEFTIPAGAVDELAAAALAVNR